MAKDEEDDDVMLTESNQHSPRADPTEERKTFSKPMDGFIKNLVAGKPRNMDQTESDDSSDDDMPNEQYFSFENNRDHKVTNVDIIKKVLRNKCGELFTKMKKNNKETDNRLCRLPVWNWEESKEDVEDPLETNKLRILSITWNMNAKKPPSDLSSLFRTDIKHDIYVVGTEECLKSILSSAFGANKKEWVDVLKSYFGDTYQNISSHSLMGTHLVVFASVRLIPIISNIQVHHVATGLMGSIGNKGGVGISFNIGQTSCLFINCHLASGEDDVCNARRTQDFLSIDKGLKLPAKFNLKKEQKKEPDRSLVSASNRFDC